MRRGRWQRWVRRWWRWKLGLEEIRALAHGCLCDTPLASCPHVRSVDVCVCDMTHMRDMTHMGDMTHMCDMTQMCDMTHSYV